MRVGVLKETKVVEKRVSLLPAGARTLIDQGHEAIAYDNLVEGHPKAVGDAELVVGDIADSDLLTRTLRDMGADAVMHFAAATNVGESVGNPEYHYRNNIGGTLSLLNAMRNAGVERMLFSSTCATYGISPVCPIRAEPSSPLALLAN